MSKHTVTTKAGRKLPTVGNLAPALETKVTRANEQYAKLGASDRENALRGLFLGGLFAQIKDEAGHGNFLPLAKARMPDIPQQRRNELMRLWGVFVKETETAVPAGLAIPDAQLALQLGKETDDEIVRAALSFVGDLSLFALMIEHDVREKKKLGGARTKGAARDAQIDAEQLRILKRDEASEVLARARALYVEENLFQHLSVDESRAVLAGLEALVTEVRDALRPVFKAATGKTKSTS